MVTLFDYDLTLYGEEERFVLDSLDRRIALFVQKTIGSDFETATKIRKDYLLRFGTTLSGLMQMNGVNPDDFFDFIHEREYLVYPSRSQEKISLIESIPGARYVFTNGRGDWSYAGMESMGILGLMDGIFDLKQMDWVGKPHESAYVKMEEFLVRKGTYIKRGVVLVEDSVRNLKPAHDRGWITVLVNPNVDTPEFVDFHIPYLLDFPLTDIIYRCNNPPC